MQVEPKTTGENTVWLYSNMDFSGQKSGRVCQNRARTFVHGATCKTRPEHPLPLPAKHKSFYFLSLEDERQKIMMMWTNFWPLNMPPRETADERPPGLTWWVHFLLVLSNKLASTSLESRPKCMLPWVQRFLTNMGTSVLVQAQIPCVKSQYQHADLGPCPVGRSPVTQWFRCGERLGQSVYGHVH